VGGVWSVSERYFEKVRRQRRMRGSDVYELEFGAVNHHEPATRVYI
jgi:hypothetical protein